MARVQTEHGPRYAMRDTIHDHQVEVATGYDVMQDNWAVHIYITTPAGARIKEEFPQRVVSVAAAFDAGFKHAAEILAPRPSAFQTEVKASRRI